MSITSNNDFCKNVNRIRLNLIHFGYAYVGNEWQGKVIDPIFSRLYYIHNGNASITTFDGIKFNLKKGMWYLLPSGCSFDYSCADNLEHVFFHLKFCDYDGLDLLSSCNAPMSISGTQNDSDSFIKNLHSTHISSHLKMYHDLYRIVLQFTEKFSIDIERKDFSQCIMKAIRYIRHNLSAQLTINEISENIFVSKSTLTKHFQKELKTTVNNYINDMIVLEAEQLLMNTDMSMLEISEKLGFSDQFYFSRKV